MKRISVIALSLMFASASLFGACTKSDTTSISEDKTSISIVCTIFPQYDWLRQILGEKISQVDLTLLLNNRIDLHSFQPSVDDIVKISSCDLFIHVGGESDAWVEAALAQAENKDMLVINLLDTLGEAAKTEEIIEGMDEEVEEDEADDEAAYDEHIWLSLRNTRLLCAAIAESLSIMDPDSAEAYRENLSIYQEHLSMLDKSYQAVVDAAPVRVLLFGDRFPFRYLVDDYDLSYHAAFIGCSAETEASFDTILFLAEKLNELNLRNVMVTESSDKRLAETIIRESGDSTRQILILDSLQSVSTDDITNGSSYLSVMENNLVVLDKALH